MKQIYEMWLFYKRDRAGGYKGGTWTRGPNEWTDIRVTEIGLRRSS